jgi:crotonobetainyl-CoA:carnitine CoA-transferase CaiB-like acyl-CoA transferase
MVGQHLADLGAEVIKVEWYSRFDLYRLRGVEHLRGKIPESQRRESSFAFSSLNRNKHSFSVDLKNDHGVDLVKRLLSKSDLLLENFTVGTLDRLGLGDAQLQEINDQLVVISLSATGRGSAIEELRGYGPMLSALGGFEREVVDSKGDFVGSPSLIMSDPNAGLFGVLGALAGVLYARRSGAGATFHCSQVEAVTSVVQAPPPNREAPLLEGIFATASGEYVAVTLDSGITAQPDLERQLEGKSTEAAIAAVAKLGGYAAPVRPLQDTPTSGEFIDRAVHQSCKHPVGGDQALIASPGLIDGQRSALRKAAPLLGEDNEYVLRNILGLNDAEIQATWATGAIGDPQSDGH